MLTALLVKHGVRHAVVCPGSRNAPIVHNLSECPAMSCYPITDERSAAFFALGLAQATDQPVAVCVTSGTALLNVAPAVAEAYYQHQSLVIVSADRPEEWIGQIDGQTMCQPGALAPWVSITVSLPIVADVQSCWYCNRLINEALLEATADHHPSVHINVPIAEPLFNFTVEHLPDERMIRRFAPSADYDCLPQAMVDDFIQARRPLIVFGQLSARRFHNEGTDYLFSHVIVLHEALAPFTSVSPTDEALTMQPTGQGLKPDFILYVGDAVVSKRLKIFLRSATDSHTWRISCTGRVEDTFQQLYGIVTGDAESILQSLDRKLSRQRCPYEADRADYRRQWLHLLSQARSISQSFNPGFSIMGAVKEFELQLADVGYDYTVHYANSTAVRMANIYAHHPVWCNRGVNGIEGSLSTAAGFAAATSSTTLFCVIGDLSFFYDQNALWNKNIAGNLRILLLNNGRGVIFDQLPGLEKSDVRHSFVAGEHRTTAEGICKQNHVDYLAARDLEEMRQGIGRLMSHDGQRPLLLEVITNGDTDADVIRQYSKMFANKSFNK